MYPLPAVPGRTMAVIVQFRNHLCSESVYNSRRISSEEIHNTISVVSPKIYILLRHICT